MVAVTMAVAAVLGRRGLMIVVLIVIIKHQPCGLRVEGVFPRRTPVLGEEGLRLWWRAQASGSCSRGKGRRRRLGVLLLLLLRGASLHLAGGIGDACTEARLAPSSTTSTAPSTTSLDAVDLFDLQQNDRRAWPDLPSLLAVERRPCA